MDVVRTNIQQLNGSITLDSTPGLGTTISFKIPLSVTLQVIKAILVRVGQQPFLIPLENIIESLRLSSENLSTVHKNGEFVNIRGRILPLIRLYEIFDLPVDHTDPTKAILMLLEAPQGHFALMVDDILDLQRVVIKDLAGGFKNPDFLAGYAPLGMVASAWFSIPRDSSDWPKARSDPPGHS